MPQAALQALLAAYRDQANWLDAAAIQLEQGSRKMLAEGGVDLSSETAAEYRHKAGNLRAIIQAYERLHAKEAKS